MGTASGIRHGVSRTTGGDRNASCAQTRTSRTCSTRLAEEKGTDVGRCECARTAQQRLCRIDQQNQTSLTCIFDPMSDGMMIVVAYGVHSLCLRESCVCSYCSL